MLDTFFTSDKCDRCKCKALSFSMSFFNTDKLCPECQEKEQKHPDYAKAKEAERIAVLNGDYNFPGIGKPDDL